MFANPYRLALGNHHKLASSQRLIGLALAPNTAGSALDQAVFPAPDVPSTIRAAREQATGRVDDDQSKTDWQRGLGGRGFCQAEPQQGNPATFEMEVSVNIADECTSAVGESRMAIKSTRMVRPTT